MTVAPAHPTSTTTPTRHPQRGEELSIAQVARRLGVKPDVIYTWAEWGHCPHAGAQAAAYGFTSLPAPSTNAWRESPAHTNSPPTPKPKQHDAWKGSQYEPHVPVIADRVVQAALKLVLEPIFEADFMPVSYGFRPGRRAHDAIAEIHYFGTRGYRWVLDADIEAAFDAMKERGPGFPSNCGDFVMRILFLVPVLP
jgi:hypothetical protein